MNNEENVGTNNNMVNFIFDLKKLFLVWHKTKIKQKSCFKI